MEYLNYRPIVFFEPKYGISRHFFRNLSINDQQAFGCKGRPLIEPTEDAGEVGFELQRFRGAQEAVKPVVALEAQLLAVVFHGDPNGAIPIVDLFFLENLAVVHAGDLVHDDLTRGAVGDQVVHVEHEDVPSLPRLDQVGAEQGGLLQLERLGQTADDLVDILLGLFAVFEFEEHVIMDQLYGLVVDHLEAGAQGVVPAHDVFHDSPQEIGIQPE